MTLRELRRERRWSQTYVANHIGVRQMLVSRYERGVLPLPKAHAFALAYLFGVRPDAIDEWANKPRPAPLPLTPLLVRRTKVEILKAHTTK